ncbi:hypothetical protein ABZ471_47265 [Streptomyces sp. NPDC005728]|uniref:hypothetical protein n=1 Tax=Streptomyces sp. NPDC005728 TaxID=3157054 RepID=UPI0033DDECA3
MADEPSGTGNESAVTQSADDGLGVVGESVESGADDRSGTGGDSPESGADDAASDPSGDAGEPDAGQQAECAEPDEETDQPANCAPDENSRESRAVWGTSAFESGPGRQKGPGLPSANDPGANFSPELYDEIANLSTADFVQLRQQVFAVKEDGPVQRSFYANGCTYVPDSVIGTQSTYDACLQHDFRYTVGPNVYKDDPDGEKTDKENADLQLGNSIRGDNTSGFPNSKGGLFETAVRYMGHGLRYPTPTKGAPITTTEELLFLAENPDQVGTD